MSHHHAAKTHSFFWAAIFPCFLVTFFLEEVALSLQNKIETNHHLPCVLISPHCIASGNSSAGHMGKFYACCVHGPALDAIHRLFINILYIYSLHLTLLASTNEIHEDCVGLMFESINSEVGRFSTHDMSMSMIYTIKRITLLQLIITIYYFILCTQQ